jgi:hypothetical protein
MIAKPWQTSGQVLIEVLFSDSSARVWSNEFDPTPGMVPVGPNLFDQTYIR